MCEICLKLAIKAPEQRQKNEQKNAGWIFKYHFLLERHSVIGGEGNRNRFV